ncbi:toxin-antitoxin system YwqK family antitoxin [Lutispora sp.]|uniref:toxin-antitoxin system YwqK family antitoxin n=1 Tax=Lutispora sp. TaxID=2828727 RepID=UPI003568182A
MKGHKQNKKREDVCKVRGGIRTLGNLVNGKLNGEGKTYYENGKIRSEGFFIDGKLNGEGKTYWDNGRVWREGSFKNDLLEGEGRIYAKDGTLIKHGKFKENKLEIDYLNGSRKIQYHKNGTIKYIGGIKDGKYHGTGTLYNEKREIEFYGEWINGNMLEAINHCWKCGEDITYTLKKCNICGGYECKKCGKCLCEYWRFTSRR